MFEKESKKYQIEVIAKGDYPHSIATDWQRGAEFGYNKANDKIEALEERCEIANDEIIRLQKINEWHYVSEKGTPKPKKEGHYLVCLCNKDKDIFDCWIYYDKDIGWYSVEVRMKDIYAWKEIVLSQEIEKK